MSINNIRLGFVGDLKSYHSDNIIKLFKSINKEIYPLDYSLSNENSIYNIYNNFYLNSKSKYLRRFYRVYSQLFGVKDSNYEKILKDYIKRYQVDCILAFWGINAIADIISIKKIRPQTKVILNILCHPTGLTPSKVFLQNKFLHLSAKYCDALVYSSNVMKQYIERNVLRNIKKPYLILPPFFSQDYFPDKRLPPCSCTPNLVFLGRMDWWAGQPSDNVLSQIESFMNCGIHVYHSDKTGRLPFNEFRHTFKPMSLLELKNFATQFNASLIIYNLRECRSHDRFRVTIPDRLTASVIFGIPVAIPRDGYDACKEFLKDYDAVIEFSSPHELNKKLSNHEYLINLKNSACVNSQKYIGERHLNSLYDFILATVKETI